MTKAPALRNAHEFATAVQRARSAAETYYGLGGNQLMTDAEFDELTGQLESVKNAHPQWDDRGLLTRVGAGVVGAGEGVHPTPMLSMDKTTRAEDVAEFVRGVAGKVSVESKIDGVALRVRYCAGRLVEMVTRGDGWSGELLDPTMQLDGLPHTISMTGEVEVRGEVFMTNDQFVANNAHRTASGRPPFANPRNATAGTLRRETKAYEASLSFAAYDGTGADLAAVAEYGQRMKVLADCGIATVRGLLADQLRVAGRPTSSPTDVVSAINMLGDIRDQLGFDIDGAVVKAESYSVRAAMGAGSRAPRWALAFKYPATQVGSVLRAIEVNVGRTGRMSLTAVVDPVSLDGSTVARATLHNPKFVAEQGLAVDSRVVVEKRGTVIPRVTSAMSAAGNHRSPWRPPTVHEACGEPWHVDRATWRCLSPQCSTVARIVWATAGESLDIEGVGTEVATALVESGLVNDIADLFTVTADQVAAVSMGERQQLIGMARAQKITDAAQTAKSQPLGRVVTALGIRTLGRTFGRRLARHFTSLDAIRAADEQAFMQVEGVGHEKAKLFVTGFKQLSEVIDRLVAAGITTQADTITTGQPLPLIGQRVAVTGSMAGTRLSALNRTQMNELIERAGGKASGSVSASTNLLVCAEPGSAKHTKAVNLGIQVQSPDDFARAVAAHLR